MKDLLTGLPLDPQSSTNEMGSPRQPVGQVYEMVWLRSQGLLRSDEAVLPGGAYPQIPGLESGTEVYQWVADTSNGIGFGPGGAMVSTPFFPPS